MPKDKSREDRLQDQIDDMHNARVDDLEERVDKVQDLVLKRAECVQGNLFTSIQTQINENSKSNKRMQTWQAGVGISLLIFFLTVGVAALRYVDQLNFDNQANKDRIEGLKEKMDEQNKQHLENHKELKGILEKIFMRNKTR